MTNFIVELDYIKSHFPDFMMSLIPKVLIGIIILQVILGLIRHSLRNSETGRAEQVKSAITTISLILWVILVALMGLHLYYYYITYIKS